MSLTYNYSAQMNLMLSMMTNDNCQCYSTIWYRPDYRLYTKTYHLSLVPIYVGPKAVKSHAFTVQRQIYSGHDYETASVQYHTLVFLRIVHLMQPIPKWVKVEQREKKKKTQVGHGGNFSDF